MIFNGNTGGIQLPELTLPAGAGQILSGYQAIDAEGNIITGTIPSQGAQTITPGRSSQTIAAGQYLSGTQTIAGDVDLVASNIRSGANIFGVAGNVQATGSASVSISFSRQVWDTVIYFNSSRQPQVQNINGGTSATVNVMTPSILILFYEYEGNSIFNEANTYSGTQPSDYALGGSSGDGYTRADIFVINSTTTISAIKHT